MAHGIDTFKLTESCTSHLQLHVNNSNIADLDLCTLDIMNANKLYTSVLSIFKSIWCKTHLQLKHV